MTPELFQVAELAFLDHPGQDAKDHRHGGEKHPEPCVAPGEFAFRLVGGAEALTAEVAELGWFSPDGLPDVRADQRGLIERHLARARAGAGGA